MLRLYETMWTVDMKPDSSPSPTVPPKGRDFLGRGAPAAFRIGVQETVKST
jgi:hypothetical protein